MAIRKNNKNTINKTCVCRLPVHQPPRVHVGATPSVGIFSKFASSPCRRGSRCLSSFARHITRKRRRCTLKQPLIFGRAILWSRISGRMHVVVRRFLDSCLGTGCAVFRFGTAHTHAVAFNNARPPNSVQTATDNHIDSHTTR